MSGGGVGGRTEGEKSVDERGAAFDEERTGREPVVS